MVIPAYHQSIITGLLLPPEVGEDGWLIFSSKYAKTARLGLIQSLAHAEYFWFVFNILSPWCNSYPTSRSPIRNETKTYALQFFTRSLPCFTELHSNWYENGTQQKKLFLQIFMISWLLLHLLTEFADLVQLWKPVYYFVQIPLVLKIQLDCWMF